MLKNKLTTLSILSGILIGTSFIPFPPWASIFAFVPLWFYWLKTQSLKKIFWSGWLCQFTLTLIGFNWIIITIHDFGGLPWPVAALGLFAFCSFATIYIPIAGLLYGLIANRVNLSALQKITLMATLLSLLEPLITTIFPWNFGYSWMNTPIPLYQTAEYIGFEGLSSIIIWLNIFAFCFFFKTHTYLSKSVSLISVFLALGSLTLWGFYLENNQPQPDQSIKIGIIQANIGNIDKEYQERGRNFRSLIVNDYFKLSIEEKKNNKPDILIWPETAAPIKLGENIQDYHNFRFKNKLKENQLSLITGTYTIADTGQTANSLVFLEEGDFVSPYYSKTHLLAFGEYIPGSSLYPAVKEVLPQISDFKPGNGPQVTLFKNVKFGSQICYESLFPSFTTGLARLGAEVIINVTNDSWYGDYMEPKQHLYMTLARAIESRRPLVRSTNTGISTVILANGEILTQSKMNTVWSHTYDVKYKQNAPITFYNRFPHLFLVLKLILLTFIIIIGFKNNEKHKKTT